MRKVVIGVAVAGVLAGGVTVVAVAARETTARETRARETRARETTARGITRARPAVPPSVAADDRSCAAQLSAEEGKIRTQRWDPPAELADLGAYLDIHWQLRARGAACSRVPGPTDWAYQAVVRLRPAQAGALAQRICATAKQSAAGEGTGPADDPAVPQDVWPGLTAFMPAGAEWVQDRAYDTQHELTRRRTLYVDVASSTAFVALTDR